MMKNFHQTKLGCAIVSIFFTCVSHAEWEQPRTQWGAPDLQGVWSNETLTPFERPVTQADKEFFTQEEATALANRKAEALQKDAASVTPNGEAPPKGGNVGGYNLGWLDNGSSVASTGRTSQVIVPRTGRVPVRSTAVSIRDAIADRSFDDPENMSVWDRCITRGIPGSMFPAGYNNYYRIIQQPDTVMIYYEMIHEARFIPLDNQPRLAIESWNGQPRGRWEDDTLVVETMGFNDQGWIANSFSQGRIKGIPSTRELKVIERFRQVDEDTIIWQATISDPSIYESEWTVEIPMESRAGAKIYEYACHEGNQAVGNILRGARVQAKLASSE
ncbi:MAG: hypothetical protein GKR90_02420 [Pseudomonadales bacterium]|nr:hypothetical protein [Pseudomonadales bacterium]